MPTPILVNSAFAPLLSLLVASASLFISPHTWEVLLKVLAIDCYWEFNAVQFFKHVRIPW
jgi:hypothetical protein